MTTMAPQHRPEPGGGLAQLAEPESNPEPEPTAEPVPVAGLAPTAEPEPTAEADPTAEPGQPERLARPAGHQRGAAVAAGSEPVPWRRPWPPVSARVRRTSPDLPSSAPARQQRCRRASERC